ncbi:MAG: response regulator [Anaerolineales bacterium]|nr:response regulator [Anaerolineales bacterium]
MRSPRILLVDDQRQVSRMLRASLELSGEGYVVVDSPSGEEALLELARGPVDLLITDLRLPGISGLDLLARVRQLNPNARAILITGQPTDEIQALAQQMGVVAFLRKPIGTSFFLEAVAHALQLSEEPVKAAQVADEEKPRLAERLASLRRDLGAEAVLLIDERAQVVARSGELLGFDLTSVLAALVTAYASGQKVSTLLSSTSPGTFQFFAGSTHDFFLSNVGADFALLIAFPGGKGARQIGAVLHLAQPATRDLFKAVSNEVTSEAIPTPPDDPEAAEEAIQRPPEAIRPDLEAASKKAKSQDPEGFWEKAVDDSDGVGPSGDELTYEQARQLGLLPDETSS